MFTKVCFHSKEWGFTAGLVLDTEKLEKMSLSEVSRLFPVSESTKMETFCRSESFETWDEAFDSRIEVSK